MLVKPVQPDVAKDRFVINVGSNLFYVVLNTGLMVWYVPYLVHNLGIAAYGMIPLANSLVMYTTIVSASLEVSISRFLAIDLNQGNLDKANRTFNTALFLSVGVCALLAVLAAGVIALLPAMFNIPVGMEGETQVLFASMAFTTMAAILSGNFGIASQIMHRFDLRNIVRSLTSVSRIAVVVACFMIWPASLWHVAAGFFASAAIGLAGDVLVWRRLTPQLRIDRRSIDRGQSGALMSLSGWSAVNQMGLLLLAQIDLLVVNAVFGAEKTGLYGSVLLFPLLISMMMETVLTVLSPAIMARYALGDSDGMRRLASRSVKLLGIALAVPVGLLCGFGGPLLTLWLGPEFAQLDLLLALLVGHLVVNLAVRPLFYVLTACNRIKAQGIVTLVLGVCNVGLVVAFAVWGGWGIAGVAVGAAIVWTLKNAVFMPAYSASVMRVPWWTFYAPLLAGAFGALAIALAGRLLSQYWWPAGWVELGLMSAALAAAYGAVAYAVALDRSDRDLLRSFRNRRIHA